MSPPAGAPVVLITGIDSVRAKLLYQTVWLEQAGFASHVLTHHRTPGSVRSHRSTEIEELGSSALSRLRQFVGAIRRVRTRIHHVELYAGGRFAFVYALAARLMRVPVIVVEWGDLNYYLRRTHPLLTRLSMRVSYRLARRIWFKEPYMGRWLRKWGLGHKAFFLPNGVPVPESTPSGERDVDFLWVNRLIPERRPVWFAEALRDLAATRAVRAVLLGFDIGGGQFSEVGVEEREVKRVLNGIAGCECHPYADPEPFYGRARFFVLPGDLVFGNFSLLEAMARGCIPVVSDADGTELLVQDGVNGLVFAAGDPDAVHEALERALALGPAEDRRLSELARSTVERDYSIAAWGERLLRAYEALDERPAPPVFERPRVAEG